MNRGIGKLTAGRPLYGLPILLKNVIATNDEMNNTGEPLSYRRHHPPH